jgi:preprotein translocase subunit SecG
MFAFITVLIIVICIILVLIVLVQNSKGGGLAAGFTGSQVMGVRKTADFLEKATWTLATAVLLLCVVANIMLPRQKTTQEKSLLQDQIQNTADPNAVPQFPTSVPAQDQNAPTQEDQKKK